MTTGPRPALQSRLRCTRNAGCTNLITNGLRRLYPCYEHTRVVRDVDAGASVRVGTIISVHAGSSLAAAPPASLFQSYRSPWGRPALDIKFDSTAHRDLFLFFGFLARLTIS
jgi:hypothetical protein